MINEEDKKYFSKNKIMAFIYVDNNCLSCEEIYNQLLILSQNYRHMDICSIDLSNVDIKDRVKNSTVIELYKNGNKLIEVSGEIGINNIKNTLDLL